MASELKYHKEGRNDSLKLEFEEYLKKEKKRKCKEIKGQPPLASQQDALEVDVLMETDRALSEDHENKSKEARHQQPPSRLDYSLVFSLASLSKLIKWIAQRCTSSHSMRCLFGEQDIVHKILHQAQKYANIMLS